MIIVFKIFGVVILGIGLYFSGYSAYELYESYRIKRSPDMIEIDGVITGYHITSTEGAHSTIIGARQIYTSIPQPVFSYSNAERKQITSVDPNYNLWKTYKRGDKIKILVSKTDYERKASGDEALDKLFQTSTVARINDIHTRYVFFGIGLVFGMLLILISWIPLVAIKG